VRAEEVPVAEKPSKVVAASLGLVAFSTSLVFSLISDVTAQTSIARAIVSMLAAYIAGYVIGKAAEIPIREFLEAHRDANPIPELDARPVLPDREGAG
jgi:hypothetical protein